MGVCEICQDFLVERMMSESVLRWNVRDSTSITRSACASGFYISHHPSSSPMYIGFLEILVNPVSTVTWQVCGFGFLWRGRNVKEVTLEMTHGFRCHVVSALKKISVCSLVFFVLCVGNEALSTECRSSFGPSCCMILRAASPLNSPGPLDSSRIVRYLHRRGGGWKVDNQATMGGPRGRGWGSRRTQPWRSSNVSFSFWPFAVLVLICFWRHHKCPKQDVHLVLILHLQV